MQLLSLARITSMSDPIKGAAVKAETPQPCKAWLVAESALVQGGTGAASILACANGVHLRSEGSGTQSK